MLAPSAFAAGALPANAVINGEMELAPWPGPVDDAAADQPILDECTGIGHQVLYGYESPQGTATGGAYGDADPEKADPAQAATNVAQDPVGEAQFATGYQHCVSGDDTGSDLVWLKPRSRGQTPAQWSHFGEASNTAFGSGFDADPFDREVKISAGSADQGLNLYQAYPNPHQAFTLNFDTYSVEIEDGSVPDGAQIGLYVDNRPLDQQDDKTVLYLHCQLTFRGADLATDADGVVRFSPLEGTFKARDQSCQDMEDQWVAAGGNDDDPSNDDEEALRDVLGRTRVVQHNFNNWHTGPEDVVLDDVAITGATTPAEELAAGNT